MAVLASLRAIAAEKPWVESSYFSHAAFQGSNSKKRQHLFTDAENESVKSIGQDFFGSRFSFPEVFGERPAISFVFFLGLGNRGCKLLEV